MPQREYIYRGRVLTLAKEGPWEIIEHAEAVCVLAEREGKLLFVRQYRPAVKAQTLEIPAGLIEKGEDPLKAAGRELAEEAQLGGELEYLVGFYPTPGFCDEKLHLFRATNLRPAQGTPDDDEDIAIEWLEPKEVLRMAQRGEVEISATTISGVLWYLAGL
jgi:ADP-ribose pyrophosphatase